MTLLTAPARRMPLLIAALIACTFSVGGLLAKDARATTTPTTVSVATTLDAVVKVKPTLLGANVNVVGQIAAAVDVPVSVSLANKKIVVKASNGAVVCVAYTDVHGTFTCNAFVNILVRASLQKAGAIVGFAGERVRGIVRGVASDIDLRAVVIVRAVVQI